MKAKVITLENKAAGEIDLADAVFAAPVRKDILARMVNYQLAKRRGGNADTKERSEIRGTTAKPFRQKGTGRARQGSRKTPNLRGGGVAFGPTPRDFGHKLQKKVRRFAMKSALSSKQAEGKLVVLKDAVLGSPKTKDLQGLLAALGMDNALIVSGPEVDQNFAKAASNLPQIDVLPTQGANVYDILRRDQLVLTEAAVQALEARLK
ncbi:MAG: 50S ribosomal protein L4 [Rhodospirillaceae bacterium]|jgi:large subunit ribosomal protein L4|nr:50S ribosomal protein L4 [Rhodospirillaceae bacterium]